MRDIIFQPPWGMLALVAVGIGLISLAIFRLLRERKLVRYRKQAGTILLRFFTLGAVLWMALNPISMEPREIEGKPHLVILLDVSSSMATADVDGKGRLQAALETLLSSSVNASVNSSGLSRLEEEFTLDVRGFDGEARPVHLKALDPGAATGRASDIGAAVSAAVGDLAGKKSQAGVLLLSDGRATTPGADEAARLALARSVPLWTWCPGGEVARRDLWMEVPTSEVLAFAGAGVELTALVNQVGYEDRVLTVELLSGGKVIQKEEATPGPAGEAPVRFRVTAPEKGESQYTFRVAPVEGESDERNNERSLFLRVVGNKVRVLVVEGQPHWDTKFLVQSLKRNPNVDLTALYRLGKDRQFAVVSSGGEDRREERDLFPRTGEDFRAFDVIVLGKECEPFFDEKTGELLTDFVSRHGGGLVFSRGKSHGGRLQALSRLDPVSWGTGFSHAVRLVPTELGSESPMFELSSTGDLDALIDRLPRFDQITHTQGIKPLAVALASGRPADGAGEAGGDSLVILASQLFGLGRVVTVNASGLWRWAFRKKGRDEDEFVYDRFWSSLLRWLLSGSDFLAGHDVALRSDRRLYRDEQPFRFLIRTRGLDREAYRPRLIIRGREGGPSTEIEPRLEKGGTYGAQAGPFPPGIYDVELVNNIGKPGRLSKTVEVISGSVEQRVLSADPHLMKRMAEVSGGRALAAGDIAGLGDFVREWRVRKQLSDQKESLWDRWWLLTAILMALALEWFLRRREGLL